MDTGIRAARDQVAQETMTRVLAVLAERFEIAMPDLRVQARDPQVRAMLQRERLAAALVDLEEATKPAPKAARRKTEKAEE